MSDRTASPLTEVRYHHAHLARVLEEAGCALLVSTYQAGQLVAIGVADGEPHLSFRRFDRAMGVAVAEDAVTVAGREQIWTLPGYASLAPALPPAGRFDRCWLPRASQVTGPYSCHEIAWGADDDGRPVLWTVNTLFSCLARVHPRFSFDPGWRPPFVSRVAAQDRCHLNGLAVRDGRPAFVTLFAPTDQPQGWRDLPVDSGVVLDVASGDVVTAGLTMPHSPRWHDGTLYVLNSGLGRLERVDLATGARECVAALPGYARGLALHRGLAFVGLSRIRETATFGRVPLSAYHDQLRCGLGVVDLATGETVATFQFANGVEEIFDVQVVAGARCPSLGDGADDQLWLLPDASGSDAGRGQGFMT